MLTYYIQVNMVASDAMVHSLLNGVSIALRHVSFPRFNFQKIGHNSFQFQTDSSALAKSIELELSNYSISVTEQS